MSRDDALKYGTIIFIITIVAGVIMLHYFFLGFVYGMRVRVAMCSLIYRKVVYMTWISTVYSTVSMKIFYFFRLVTSIIATSPG